MRISHSQDNDTGIQKPVYAREDLQDMFLPIGQMLQLDRVMEMDGLSAVCELDVLEHWVFPMHFPRDPIFPGTLLIEAAGQAVAVVAWHHGFRGRPRLVKVNAKFEQPVYPQDSIVTLRVGVRRRNSVFLGCVDVTVQQRAIATIEPVLILVP